MTTGLDADSLELMLESIREFAASKLTDEALLELDARDEFPDGLVREMCGDGLGISLLGVPEAYGGVGGSSFDIYRVCEDLARIDLGIATGVLATFLGCDPIVFGGTEEQKRRWMSRIADEGILMAYGATEPDAGSDLAALRTRAEPVQENGVVTAYEISGNKQWISNGGFADLYTILALAPGGPSWFVVERGAPGFSHGKPEDKHGIRASNTAALSLQDVRVPASSLVGEIEGKGLVQAQAVFGYTRLMVAAFGLGAGWAALDRAIAYSRERIQGGQPLSEKQGFTHKLIVPHAARLEAGRALIEQTATRLDAGETELNTEGAIAKYVSTEAGNAAAEAAIQGHGGYGYTREYMVEKIKRDVRITTIYEGTSEIMEMTIGRDRWQQHIKTRGTWYHDRARIMESLHVERPKLGADVAALTLHALAEVFETARTHKLTRNQHVLFRLGELAAWSEASASLVGRAALAQERRLSDKSDRRFAPDALAALARVYARDAAQRVAVDGWRWVAGSGEFEAAELDDLARRMNIDAILRAQRGGIADMDVACGALYRADG
jgi:alkylation response protein AidB-like acyl-CoA dehydrogenase